MDQALDHDSESCAAGGLPDVADLPITDLLQLGDSALGPALRRLRDHSGDGKPPVAGFGAAP